MTDETVRLDMLIWVYAVRLSLSFFFAFMNYIMQKIPITYMCMRTRKVKESLKASADFTRRIVGCIAGYCEICLYVSALSDQALCWSRVTYSSNFYASHVIGKWCYDNEGPKQSAHQQMLIRVQSPHPCTLIRVFTDCIRRTGPFII